MNIGRRNFLKVSSAAIATVTLAPRLLAGDEAPRRLVVGYASLGKAQHFRPASTLGSGDGAFISRGARISLSGLAGAEATAKAGRAVELVVNYTYSDGAERKQAPFVAWGSNTQTGSHGSPISFTVPVDEEQRISIDIRTQRNVSTAGALTSRRRAVGGPGEPMNESHPIFLTLLSEEGTKLQRGNYAIVPLFGGDPEPLWYAYEVAMVDGRRSLVDDAGEPASFPHFIVRVDYATAG